MNLSIKVLLIEDNALDARLVRDYLAEVSGAHYDIDHCTRLSDGIDRLTKHDIDVVLLDLTLPDSSGIETLSEIVKTAPESPVIVLTGLGDEEVSSNAVQKGAQDFLEKNGLSEKILQRSIRYSIDRKQTEMNLRRITEELKKLDHLKSEFVSTVSHELRTPMTIVREGVSQMLDGLLGEITSDQRQFLTMSLEGIDRLSGIINDLLDMSKLEAGRIDINRNFIDFVSLAERAVQNFMKSDAAIQKKLTIQSKSDKKSVWLYADQDKLMQVLINLLGNAIKFTDSGSIVVCVEDRADTIICSVRDMGRGISEEDIGKVFDKFHQLGRTPGPGVKGTGLGLSICKALVEVHKGKIWVESKVQDGSTFKFSLPKFSVHQIFEEVIEDRVTKSIKREEAVSFIVVKIASINGKSGDGAVSMSPLFTKIGRLVQKTLRRSGDMTVGVGGETILAVLSATEKKDAMIVETRIRESIDQFIQKEECSSKINVSYHLAGFPLDGPAPGNIMGKLVA
jgi:signal transduction histidine kinase